MTNEPNCTFWQMLPAKKVFPFVFFLVLFTNVVTVNGANAEREMQSVDYSSEFTICKDETVKFPDGFKLTFSGHSHKMVMVGGPASPLIVIVEYELKGEKDSFVYNVYPEEKATWYWQERYFLIVDFEYGSSMKLKVANTATLQSVDYDNEFIIRKGETVNFPDGLKMTFNSLRTGKKSSPNVVSVDYVLNGEGEEHSTYVDPDEGESWEWDERIFYVVDYINGEKIKLRVVDTSISRIQDTSQHKGEQAMGWQDNIQFTPHGNTPKSTIFEEINRAVHANMQLKDEGIEGGLAEWNNEFNIHVILHSARIEIDLAPKSDEGHDFSFSIERSTGNIINLSVGQPEPEPDDQEEALEDDEIYSILEGHYAFEEKDVSYRLSLYGPNTGGKVRHQYGEKFTFSRTETNQSGGGMMLTYRGAYTVSAGILSLTANHFEQESWNEAEESEGEAFGEEYNSEPYIGSIDLSGKDPVIHLNAFDADTRISMIKVK